MDLGRELEIFKRLPAFRKSSKIRFEQKLMIEKAGLNGKINKHI